MTSYGNPKKRDLTERTFRFALQVIKLCRHLEVKSGVSRILARQLLRSGTSIGANVEEAQAAQSRPDFINKNSVALKEARETHYWLRLIADSGEVPSQAIASIQREATELRQILGAVVVSSKRNAQ